MYEHLPEVIAAKLNSVKNLIVELNNPVFIKINTSQFTIHNSQFSPPHLLSN